MKSCKDCSSRIVWDCNIGDMEKCKFIICGFRPKLRMKPKTIPKWCPRINEFEESVKKNE
jgi:hypothetical protein